MKLREGYDNLVSSGGEFWAAGAPAATGGNSVELLDIQTGEMRELNTGARLSGPRRGGFDPYGNPWFGGATGSLVELDAKANRIREYWPPTPYSPYTDFYEAMPDRNGEVWAGILHGREFVRFNPETGRWREYAMPEPFAHDRRTWIDNSTHPVTLCYVDYQGYIVRIQPLD
jgi:streptogramin lyase